MKEKRMWMYAVRGYWQNIFPKNSKKQKERKPLKFQTLKMKL